MNDRTKRLVILAVVLALVIALFAGGGRALWNALLAMHGIHQGG